MLALCIAFVLGGIAGVCFTCILVVGKRNYYTIE
jgi:hypothetical protein